MARFNARTYDPATDSSKGHQKHRTADGNEGVVLIVGEGECPDGCGGKPNGKNRVFRQGHDARLKGILIRAGATGNSVTTVTNGKATTETAATIAKRFGFAGQVAAGIEREQGKAKAREAREASRAAAAAERKAKKNTAKGGGGSGPKKGDRFPVKVGRWTFEGEIVKVSKGVATLQYEKKDGTVMEIEKAVEELTA